MTYAGALQYLYDLRHFGAKLGLDNMLRLAAAAGHPESSLRFIHVAGTNGKGSTCALLESIYRAAGYKTGLFTSPHLVSFRERIQVNRQLMSEAEVVAKLRHCLELIEKTELAHHPTFFEVVTLMALLFFRQAQCEVVVWETGMGGRLDATNIVTPLASVITNIQYDHTKWLGSTLPAIASEKAGIIKPGVPAITATDDPAALEVLRQKAEEFRSPFHLVTGAEFQALGLKRGDLPLLGQHQLTNASLAMKTVELLQNDLPAASKAVAKGVREVRWAGRFQVAERGCGQRILLDGAHNVAGAEAFRETFQGEFPGEKPALVVGILRDKQWEKMCEVFASLGGRILLCPVASERTTHPEELLQACRQAHPAATITLHSNLADALAAIEQLPFVVITGSLHFIGEAMELLGLGPEGTSERHLNEGAIRK